MKKLRNLPDGIKFNLRNVGAIYTLQKLDRKRKTAIITSDWSGYTYVKDWNTKIFQVVDKVAKKILYKKKKSIWDGEAKANSKVEK